MKWIKIREGHYRLVDDNDDRPEVHLPKKEIGNFSMGYKPGWVNTLNRVNPHPEAMDSEGERRAIDLMLNDRDKETRISKKAAGWERGRRVAWNKNVKYKKAENRKHRREVEEAKETAIEFLSSRAKKNKEK